MIYHELFFLSFSSFPLIQEGLLSVTSESTVKPVLSGHSKRRLKLGFKTNYRLMQVKSIAEYSKGSILQYFRPSLSYHMSLRSLFYLFVSGRLRQALLYMHKVLFNRLVKLAQEINKCG